MIGTVLDDRYDIKENINKGGTSIIYRAVDRKTKNIVAIKVLNAKFSSDKMYVSRFENEVQATLSFEHKNIINVIDAGHIDDIYYLVMEFIDGKSVKDIINERGRMEIKEAIEITKFVCYALKYAHDSGFIHRDIKPQNIMIDKSGQVKITDFGIVRNIMAKEERIEKEVIGSVQYIAPEQIKKEKTDKRSDIYSLGISLFEMVTGKLPFEGNNHKEVALKHIDQPMPNALSLNKNVNNALNKVILKATQKNKRYRYHNMAEFADHLSKVFEKPNGEYVKVVKEYKKVSRKEIKRIHRKLFRGIAIVVFVVLLLAGSLGTFVYFGIKSYGKNAIYMEKIKVPELTGLSETDVMEMAMGFGIQIVRKYDYSETVKQGLSISQSPRAGDDIIVNGDVTVVFSQGVQVINMPDVLNQHIDEAINVLTGQSLNISEIEYIEGDNPGGYVIEQIPEAEQLIPIDEQIKLIVSKKTVSDKLTIPDFVGLTIKEVAEKMNETIIQTCFVYLENREENKRDDEVKVFDQSPPADMDGDMDAPVFVWVNSYIPNFYFEKSLALDIEHPDTLLRVTIVYKNDSSIEYVMHETKLDKGSHVIDFEIISEMAKEEVMHVYLNDVLYDEQEIDNWRRIE